jgi:hypothetical protein
MKKIDHSNQNLSSNFFATEIIILKQSKLIEKKL